MYYVAAVVECTFCATLDLVIRLAVLGNTIQLYRDMVQWPESGTLLILIENLKIVIVPAYSVRRSTYIPR